MKRFIRRAIFVAAAASAIAAYLSRKSEEKDPEYIEIKEGNDEVPEQEKVGEPAPEKPAEVNDEIEALLQEISGGIDELKSEVVETVEEIIPEIKEKDEDLENLIAEIDKHEEDAPVEEKAEEAVEEVQKTVEEKAEEETEKLEETAEEVVKKVDEAVEEAVETVPENIDEVAEKAEEVKEAVEELVENVEEKVEEPVVDVIADAEPIEIIETGNEEASIDSILDDLLDSKEEKQDVESKAEEVIEPIIDVEVPADLPPHDTDEIIDEVFETVAPVETTVTDIIEEPKPFPHLSENKIKSIKSQINAMLAAVGECRELELEHRAVFNNYSDYESYKIVADGLGYEMDDIDEHNEVRLTNTVKATESQLNQSVLTLADSLSAYRGNYKGWGVKDIIE